jgi:hypothetical protein
LNILQFLFGKNMNESVSLKPGTFYLDIEKNELWYDDPSNTSTEHRKVIDVDTLICKDLVSVTYPSEGTEDFPLDFILPETSGTSAVLGIAILGSAILGTS